MNPLILNEDENRINISEFDQNNDNKSVSLTHNQGNTSTKSTQTNQSGSEEKNEGISEPQEMTQQGSETTYLLNLSCRVPLDGFYE